MNPNSTAAYNAFHRTMNNFSWDENRLALGIIAPFATRLNAISGARFVRTRFGVSSLPRGENSAVIEFISRREFSSGRRQLRHVSFIVRRFND
jgi:hypothetical protein